MRGRAVELWYVFIFSGRSLQEMDAYQFLGRTLRSLLSRAAILPIFSRKLTLLTVSTSFWSTSEKGLSFGGLGLDLVDHPVLLLYHSVFFR